MMMIQLSGKSTHFGSKMLVCSKNKVKFWPKPKIQNRANTKPLNLELWSNWLALYFYHDWRNALELQKRFKNSSLKEIGPNYSQNFFCSHNPGQNIWHKVDKSSKIGQDFKNLLSNFMHFFGSYCQSLISGRKTGHYTASPTKFDISLIFSNFLRS